MKQTDYTNLETRLLKGKTNYQTILCSFPARHWVAGYKSNHQRSFVWIRTIKCCCYVEPFHPIAATFLPSPLAWLCGPHHPHYTHHTLYGASLVTTPQSFIFSPIGKITWQFFLQNLTIFQLDNYSRLTFTICLKLWKDNFFLKYITINCALSPLACVYWQSVCTHFRGDNEV